MEQQTRREFAKKVLTLALAFGVNTARSMGAAHQLPEPTPTRLPRWRGFNLLEKIVAKSGDTSFREEDFEIISNWGFNFVRLPLSYRCWSAPSSWREIREDQLKDIDEAIEFGGTYGIHVCLNFHRAPGYSVNHSIKEPFNLWTDSEALDACAYQWAYFAERYRGYSNARLSFNLINEPALVDGTRYVDGPMYARVISKIASAIREKSPDRLIIADGLDWGRIPCPELKPLGVAQSTRGYDPQEVSHWGAPWLHRDDPDATAEWPFPMDRWCAAREMKQLKDSEGVFSDNPWAEAIRRVIEKGDDWDGDRINAQMIEPWKGFEQTGVGVHVGEFGASHLLPHGAAMAYMRDLLAAWKHADWGWALWNLRGPYGVLDCERRNLRPEQFLGHQLDRELLELLRAG